MIRLTLSVSWLCTFSQLTTEKTHRLYVNLSLSDDEDGIAMFLALLYIHVCSEAALGKLDS